MLKVIVSVKGEILIKRVIMSVGLGEVLGSGLLLILTYYVIVLLIVFLSEEWLFV